MDIFSLESTMHSGFHDALLHNFSFDLMTRKVRFRLEVCVGDPTSEDPDLRDAYRHAELALTGVRYLIIDPPDEKYPQWKSPLALDLCEADIAITSKLGITSGAFAARFYSPHLNGFMHFEATDSSLVYGDLA